MVLASTGRDAPGRTPGADHGVTVDAAEPASWGGYPGCTTAGPPAGADQHEEAQQ
ncbi:hypothetical protein [Pseudonocardia acidicola]|uniref:Uncharacterized protein n=1 Tax=Pseudonocardia acidicola TaxID=2724939 RepID=A0ABX1S3V5_9PSEU|nr:hypothetical protein [Pseudonocardia acidicola]NMH96264.1 hypothetical protein [Pseudonocardia acidicola]